MRIALVCGGSGFAVLALVMTSLREVAAMRRWPVATGRVGWIIGLVMALALLVLAV